MPATAEQIGVSPVLWKQKFTTFSWFCTHFSAHIAFLGFVWFFRHWLCISLSNFSKEWPNLLDSAFCNLTAGNGLPERYLGTPILGFQNSYCWIFLTTFLGIIFGWCVFAFVLMSPHCCSSAFNAPFYVFPASATWNDQWILGKTTGNDIIVPTSSVYWLFHRLASLWA